MDVCSALNLVAFAKIMKKYDKVVRQKFGPVYIREVERSYFASSDKVRKDESTFIKLLLSSYLRYIMMI